MKNKFVERNALLFNIQKYSIYDGPGIRTLVFFKGCPLRCKWCSNPEGLHKKYEIMFLKEHCTDCKKCISVCPNQIHEMKMVNGIDTHIINRDKKCKGCGLCVESCPNQALSLAGNEMLISEVLDIILQDQDFYFTSGGGVTLGGGEVSLQSDFAANLLMECKRLGLHTAIETCGYGSIDVFLKMAPYIDLFLYDIKHMDTFEHYQNTAVHNERILDNLIILLEKKYNVVVRMPLIKDINTDANTIKQTIDFLLPFKDKKNFKGIELLPYHQLGVHKYKQLDMQYPLTKEIKVADAELERISEQIKNYGIAVKIIQH